MIATETKYICDICGRKVDKLDLRRFKANDFWHLEIGHKFERWDICRDCLREIGEKIRNKCN